MKTEKPEFDTRIVTPTFRLSYPYVFTARENKLAKRQEYTIQMLFPKATAKNDLANMVKLMNDLVINKWGKKPATFLSPFEDGDVKKDSNPAGEGMIVVRSWTKNKPGVVNSKNEIIMDADEVYGGCFCRAQVNAYAWEFGGKFGVNFSLLNLQKVKDGDPFGNRSKPEDAFAPVAEVAETPVTADDMFA